MFTAPSDLPVLRSITDGIPNPIAATRSSASGSIASAIASSSASCESVGVGTSCCSCSVPSASIDPVAIFVPPRSTPMTRWAPTGRGYHTAPDGGRREALPALQGRPHEREGADGPASGAAGPCGVEPREAARQAAVAPADRPCRARAGRPAARLAGRQLPGLPQRRQGGERAAAEGRGGEPRASGRPAADESVADHAARHRRRQDGSAPGLPPLRLDPARPHRPEAAPDGIPLRSRATSASTSPARGRTRSTPPSSSAGRR